MIWSRGSTLAMVHAVHAGAGMSAIGLARLSGKIDTRGATV